MKKSRDVVRATRNQRPYAVCPFSFNVEKKRGILRGKEGGPHEIKIKEKKKKGHSKTEVK